MTTLGLLWGTTWRGGACGLLAGTMAGTAYGAFFANALIFIGLFRQENAYPFDPADIPRAAFAMLFLALIGSVTGALFGIPTGLIVGTANGLLLGLLTRAFFYPLKSAQSYRYIVAIISALFTTIAAWMCFLGIMLFYANRSAANIPALAIIVTLPALIAGMGAGIISQFIARWYERETRKGVMENA